MAVPAMTDNSPVAGSIAWGQFTIKYGTTEYVIPAGSTPYRWVWWEYRGGGANSTIVAGDDIPATLADDDLVLFGNKNGVGIRIQSASLVDGELIVDGTVLAKAIDSDYVYTGLLQADQIEGGELSAQIALVGAIAAVGDGGQAVTFSGDGFVVLGPDSLGNPAYVVFPTDGRPNIISGQLQALSLLVAGDPDAGLDAATFRGTSHIDPSSTLVLESTVQAPSVAPVISTDYDNSYFMHYPSSLSGVTHIVDWCVMPNGTQVALAWDTNAKKYYILRDRVNVGGEYVQLAADQIPVSVCPDPSNANQVIVVAQNPNDSAYKLYLTYYPTGNTSGWGTRLAPFYDTGIATDGLLTTSSTRRLRISANGSGIALAYKRNSDDRIVLITATPTMGSKVTYVSSAALTADAHITGFTTGTGETGTTNYAWLTHEGTTDVSAYQFVANFTPVAGKSFPKAGSGNQERALQWIGGVLHTADATRPTEFAQDGSGPHFRYRSSKYTSFFPSSTAGLAYSYYNSSSGAESLPSPVSTAALKARSRVTVSGSAIPTGATGLRFYGRSTSSAGLKWQGEAASPSMSIKITTGDLSSGTAAPTTNTFATGTPARLVSRVTDNDDGSTQPSIDLRGDGYVRFRSIMSPRAIFTSSTDANNAGGNKPPLLVGPPAGNHLRIDGNEILSMDSDTAQGVLYLNIGGTTNTPTLTATTATVTNLNGINCNFTTLPTGFTANGQYYQFPNIPTTSAGANVNMLTSVSNRLRLVTSSRRFKENIHDAEIDVRQALKLAPRVFQRNDELDPEAEEDGVYLPVTEDSPWYAGFIAEEALELGFEGWVTHQADGEVSGFDYMTWVVTLQAICRKQQEELDNVQEQLRELKAA